MDGWMGEDTFLPYTEIVRKVHASLADPTFPSVECTVKPLPDFSQEAFKTLSIHPA